MPGTEKASIIFDTCVIDDLIDDSDSAALMAGLTSAYSIKLTMLNIGEIGAIAKAERRTLLLTKLRPLLWHDENVCLLPPHAILRRLLDGFRNNPDRFHWHSVDIRFPAGEEELARGEIMNDEMAAHQLEFQNKYKKQFRDLMRGARPGFDSTLSVDRNPPPPEFFRDTALQQGRALWSVGKWLFNEEGKAPLDDEGVTKFYNSCPPYQAFVLATFISFYDNSIESLDTKNRGLGDSKRAKASRNDLFQALYLPYCNYLLSTDEGCLSALKWVSQGLEKSATVMSYKDFVAPILKPLS
jgi:hypothetical protein